MVGERPVSLLSLPSSESRASDSFGPGGIHMLERTAGELPGAVEAFAQDLWSNPKEAVLHAGQTLVTSAAIGSAIGYVVPARGPAALAVGAAFTIPIVYHAGKRVANAWNESKKPGANQDAIARSLAYDTVSGTYDFGLAMAGGIGGAEMGMRLARSNTFAGRWAQNSQRGIATLENRGMLAVRDMLAKPEPVPAGGIPRPPGTFNAEIFTAKPKSSRPDILPEELPVTSRRLGIINRRIDQFSQNQAPTPTMQDYNVYLGSLHGHSRYSDGIGLPRELYQKARDQGIDFTAITDHNHRASRGGVKKDSPRGRDQQGTPTVAEAPIQYAQTFADAAAVSQPGEFVGLVGLELGTIGKVGHKHKLFEDLPGRGQHIIGQRPPTTVERYLGEIEASVQRPVSFSDIPPSELPAIIEAIRAESLSATRLGGVNHINLLEVPTFFEAVRQPRRTTVVRRLTGRDDPVVVKEPEIIKYNDGDFRALANHLDRLKDTTGERPVIQLNHPRYRADENPNLPAHLRGRDYGQKSFRNTDEWLQRFVDPYVRQIELIKGGALTRGPVDVVKPGHIDPVSFAGYIDKGVHASPTFGRDFHYGNPGGNPGATGVLASSLDKPALMHALRQRRTFATTNGEKLQGSLWANDRHPMGSILDQAAVPEMSLRVDVRGSVVPEAQYKVKLMGDTRVGDGKLATVMQERTVTGRQLLDGDGTISFDPIRHTMGRKSAYYAEIHRTDPFTGHTDKMWTAPIWVEPLSGASHSMFLRTITGVGADNTVSSLLPSG